MHRRLIPWRRRRNGSAGRTRGWRSVLLLPALAASLAFTACQAAPTAGSGTSGEASTTPSGVHACAVTAGGAVKCWGIWREGPAGKRGNPGQRDPGRGYRARYGRAPDHGRRGTRLRAAGRSISQVLGPQPVGQLGDGATTDRMVPVVVRALRAPATSGAVEISAKRFQAGAKTDWGPCSARGRPMGTVAGRFRGVRPRSHLARPATSPLHPLDRTASHRGRLEKPILTHRNRLG